MPPFYHMIPKPSGWANSRGIKKLYKNRKYFLPFWHILVYNEYKYQDGECVEWTGKLIKSS